MHPILPILITGLHVITKNKDDDHIDEDYQIAIYENSENIIIKNSEKSLEEKLEFEKLISGFSSRFISLPWTQIDAEIDNSLKTLVEFLKFERGTLLELSGSEDDLIVTHQLAQPGIRRTSGSYSNRESVPWFFSQLMAGKTIILSSIDDLPPEAVKEREAAYKIKFKSSITIPLSASGKSAKLLDHLLKLPAPLPEERQHILAFQDAVAPGIELMGKDIVDHLFRGFNKHDILVENALGDLVEPFKIPQGIHRYHSDKKCKRNVYKQDLPRNVETEKNINGSCYKTIPLIGSIGFHAKSYSFLALL